MKLARFLCVLNFPGRYRQQQTEHKQKCVKIKLTLKKLFNVFCAFAFCNSFSLIFFYVLFFPLSLFILTLIKRELRIRIMKTLFGYFPFTLLLLFFAIYFRFYYFFSFFEFVELRFKFVYYIKSLMNDAVDADKATKAQP